jgi:flagellar biosynthetic protein FlhB
MAEGKNDQEKTEEATPKKQEESREKGQVAKSRELPSVAILGASLIYFYFNAASMTKQLMDMMKTHFSNAGRFSIAADNIQPMLIDVISQTFMILMPFLMVVLISGVIANILQVGFIFSSESISPKFSKVDPFKGLQRLFSLQSLMELVKNILKMVIVGTVAYLTIRSESSNILPMINLGVQDILIYIAKVSFKILYTTFWVLVVLAVMDYAYQKWEHTKNLRMSKQEIKEENKQTDGDPFIKGRIRRLQREMARKRMMAAIPKADVVITNPTHFAVAIRYDAETMNAPCVVAKGADFLAQKIKEIARENGIPLIENKMVAQVLYKMVAVDQAVPENLYKAIAEILASVYSLKR